MKKKSLVLALMGLLMWNVSFAQETATILPDVKKGSIQWISKDKQFKYSVGGRVYFDAAAYFDDETDLGSGSELRDVRLSFKATVWKNWNAKINLGFAGGKVSPKDIYLQYNINQNSFLRSGYFFEPFGLERTESSKSIKYLEVNSTTEAFAPGRNLGVEYARWGEKWYWEAGLFGDSDVNNKEGGDEGYGITSRFVWVPMKEQGKILHFGMAGTYRTADAALEEGEQINQNIVYKAHAATHVEGRRFINADIDLAEDQFKYGFEFLCAYESLSLQGEYMGAHVGRKQLVGANINSYEARGWYAQMGWLLIGDQYNYKLKSARLAAPKPGSLELIVRYNETDLNDSKALVWGGKQTDFSLGGIYAFNSNIGVKLNYTHVTLDENALNGKERFGMIQARLQMAF